MEATAGRMCGGPGPGELGRALWAAWMGHRGGEGGPHRGHRMGPPWAGGSFGWGFPGGPGGWGGPGGGRPRQRKGDVRAAVLALLAEQPMHGYQIITELAERSGGAWRPSPGSVYPTLQQLQDEGLVTVAETAGRRTFTLTDAGRQEAASSREAADRAPWEQLSEEPDDPAGVLRRRAGEVMAAVMQVAAAGTPEQAERAERLLADTRRALYRLLAEDEEGGSSSATS